MRLMTEIEYLIISKGTKFMRSRKFKVENFKKDCFIDSEDHLTGELHPKPN